MPERVGVTGRLFCVAVRSGVSKWVFMGVSRSTHVYITRRSQAKPALERSARARPGNFPRCHNAALATRWTNHWPLISHSFATGFGSVTDPQRLVAVGARRAVTPKTTLKIPANNS